VPGGRVSSLGLWRWLREVMFEAFALGAFWIAAIKLWVLDGPKIPLIFIAVWLTAFFSIPLLHWPSVLFIVLSCLLAVVLFLIDRYKAALP
jgi:hypothetical protein